MKDQFVELIGAMAICRKKFDEIISTDEPGVDGEMKVSILHHFTDKYKLYLDDYVKDVESAGYSLSEGSLYSHIYEKNFADYQAMKAVVEEKESMLSASDSRDIKCHEQLNGFTHKICQNFCSMDRLSTQFDLLVKYNSPDQAEKINSLGELLDEYEEQLEMFVDRASDAGITIMGRGICASKFTYYVAIRDRLISKIRFLEQKMRTQPDELSAVRARLQEIQDCLENEETDSDDIDEPPPLIALDDEPKRETISKGGRVNRKKLRKQEHQRLKQEKKEKRKQRS